MLKKTISKEDREIVRNIKFQRSIEDAIEIILESGWDFTDPRRRLEGDPEYLRKFLTSHLEGRAMAWDDMPLGKRRLLGYIVDAWLAAHKA
jgi:hypothetical protein